MKNTSIFALFLLFIFAACSTPPVATVEPSPVIVPTNTTIPTQTIAPTETVVPSPTPDPVIFRDDFDGSIDPGWTVQNINKTTGLSNNPGWLELIAKSPVGAKNYLLRPIPEGNFDLETKLIFEPVANYQIAGLIIYYNASNFVQFGRAFVNGNDGFYMDNVKSGNFNGDNFATAVPGTDTVFLRLRRQDDTYTSFFSEDGSHWIKIGEHTSTIKPKSVGLMAGQSTSGSRPAQFDYFVINKIY